MRKRLSKEFRKMKSSKKWSISVLWECYVSNHHQCYLSSKAPSSAICLLSSPFPLIISDVCVPHLSATATSHSLLFSLRNVHFRLFPFLFFIFFVSANFSSRLLFIQLSFDYLFHLLPFFYFLTFHYISLHCNFFLPSKPFSTHSLRSAMIARSVYN